MNADVKKSVTFNVGDGAAIIYYSDVVPCTVIRIVTPRKVIVQEDNARLLNGFDSGEPDALVAYPGGFCAYVEGVQRYEFSPDPDGKTHTFTLRKNGTWVREKSTMKGSTRLSPGRRKFYDYNF